MNCKQKTEFKPMYKILVLMQASCRYFYYFYKSPWINPICM